MRHYSEEDLLEYDSSCGVNINTTSGPYYGQTSTKVMVCTSVCSETLFSLAGNVLSQCRNRLLPENADRLVFLCNNINRLHANLLKCPQSRDTELI